MLLCSTVAVSTPIPRPTAGDSTRRPSAILARRAEVSLSARDAHHPSLLIPFPSSSSRRADRAEPPPSLVPAVPRHPALILRTPSCSTSPRTHSTPPRARPCPTPAESNPQAATRHRRPPQSFALSVDDPPLALPRPKRTPGELSRNPLILPNLLPA